MAELHDQQSVGIDHILFFTDVYHLVEVDTVVICGSHFLPTMELGV